MFQSFFTSDWLLTFDMEVYKLSEKLFSSVMDPIMIFITHLGDEGIFWISVCLVLLMFKKTRKLGLAGIVALGFASVMNSIVFKDIFARERPFIMDYSHWAKVATDGWEYKWRLGENLKETTWSFPSGHTASSFAAATGIFYIDKKKGIIPFILAFLIGFSRIYIHVHYPSDVVAGMLTGIIFGLIACLILFKGFGKLLDKINEKFNYKLFHAEVEGKQEDESKASEVAQETEVEIEEETEAEAEEQAQEEKTEE